VNAISAWRHAAVNAAERSDAVAHGILPALRAAGDAWDLGMALLALGTNAVNRGDAAGSRQLLDEARDLVVGRDEAPLLCWIDLWLGWAILLLDDSSAAREIFEEALAKARETGSETNVAFALSKLGIVADYEGAFAAGMEYHLEANAGFVRVGNPAGVGYAMGRASVGAYATGSMSLALEYAEAAVEAWATIDHAWGTALALCRVGMAHVGLGNLDDGRRRFVDAYEVARAAEIGYLETYALAGLTVLLRRQGDIRRALRILGAILDDPEFPGLYKRQFEPEYDAMIAELGPDRTAEIRSAAGGPTLSELAAELLSPRGEAVLRAVPAETSVL
jgi:hypothetical protein